MVHVPNIHFRPVNHVTLSVHLPSGFLLWSRPRVGLIKTHSTRQCKVGWAQRTNPRASTWSLVSSYQNSIFISKYSR